MAEGISQVVNVLKSWFKRLRDSAKEQRRVSHARHMIAATLGGELDRFAADCLAVTYDDGTSHGRPASEDGIYHQATVSLPSFNSTASQIDLSALPPELAYTILDLPSRTIVLERSLEDPGYDDPPEHSSFFKARQMGYAELGLKAARLARQLRQLAGVVRPSLLQADVQPHEVMLRGRLEQLEDAEIASYKRWAVLKARSARESLHD